MSTQQLTMYTDKKLVPVPQNSGDWNSIPYGMVFPSRADPVDAGDYYKWVIETDFDGEASQKVQDSFFNRCASWATTFSPYNGERPDGMYFFFGLWLYINMPCGGGYGSLIYIARGKSGKENPWWSGSGGFTVSGDHKSATITYLGGSTCTNAKTIEIISDGNVGEINFYINKYTTS